SIKQRSAMTLEEDYKMFSDLWKLYRKYREVRVDNEYWQDLIKDTDKVYEKYQTVLCKRLLLEVLDEFERRFKNENVL
ncbi:hypothetical protein RFZ45_01155, partial [Acinetobacter baumannii]|nr:hypothetical protein [Acinetobacter baumannii]